MRETSRFISGNDPRRHPILSRTRTRTQLIRIARKEKWRAEPKATTSGVRPQASGRPQPLFNPHRRPPPTNDLCRPQRTWTPSIPMARQNGMHPHPLVFALPSSPTSCSTPFFNPSPHACWLPSSLGVGRWHPLIPIMGLDWMIVTTVLVVCLMDLYEFSLFLLILLFWVMIWWWTDNFIHSPHRYTFLFYCFAEELISGKQETASVATLYINYHTNAHF